MEEYKIEHNIPIPEVQGLGRPVKYPLRKMQVGESIFIGDKKPKGLSGCCAFGKRNNMKFVLRAENAGTRIWRVE